MSSDVGNWNSVRLGDVLTLVKGVSYKSEELSGGGLLIGLKAILPGGGFRNDGPKSYNGKHKPQHELAEGDLVMALTDITQDGSVLASPALIPALSAKPVVASLDIAKVEITDPSRLDSRFLFYVLRGREVRSWANGHASGTTIRRIKVADVLDRVQSMPRLPEQRRIVRTLRALDDKIESNRRLASTLEEVVTTLFKARFVDFVGHDDLVESEIGMIPRGWQAKPVGDLAQYVNGKAFTKEATGTGKMVIRIADLKSGPGGSTVYSEREVEDKFKALPGDILFAWSGSLDVYRWHRDEALINQHIFKVIPEGYPAWFVFYALKSVMPQFQGIAADKATTMGHIKRGDLETHFVAVPPVDVLGTASLEFEPLFDLSLAARVESETHAAVRDTLLPKLISGELRVPEDAFDEVEAA